MSKGSERISVRVPEALQAAMDGAIARHNNNPAAVTTHTITTFVVGALWEKIAKLNRSRKTKSKAKRTVRGKAKLTQREYDAAKGIVGRMVFENGKGGQS